MKTEIARRLLDADRALAPPPRRHGLDALARDGAILPPWRGAGASGRPLWYPDLPIRERLAMVDESMASAPAAESSRRRPAPPVQPDGEFMALMEKLRAAVDPATATDLRVLDRRRGTRRRWAIIAAKAAQSRLVEVKIRPRPRLRHAGRNADPRRRRLGVSPEAEQALVRALQLDPADGMARYFSA